MQIQDVKKQERIVSTYWDEIQVLEDEEVQSCMEQAKEYNASEVKMISYEKQLNLFGNGMMGSLDIPKIRLNLPIYHGTSEEALAKGVGHLKESSLPIGGIGTHSVLTGHRGLPEAQLFTRLDELEKGDLFFLRICNQTLVYQVKTIATIKPEEVEILAVQEERDLVSLITCTPYGLNTHRLVVTGERVEEKELTLEQIESSNVSRKGIVLIVIIWAILVVIILWKMKRNR